MLRSIIKRLLDTGGKSTLYYTPEVLRRSTNQTLELALSGHFSWQKQMSVDRWPRRSLDDPVVLIVSMRP